MIRPLSAFALGSLLGCAAIAPALDALPGVVSAVEAVTKAAEANRVAVPADVLAEAKALDAAHEASEKARDRRIAAILAAVRRKPVACVPADAGVVVDGGEEAGK